MPSRPARERCALSLPTSETALATLQYRYAHAIDNRDAEELVAIFDPDVVYRVFAPGADEPRTETRGNVAVSKVVDAMAERFVQTVHAMSSPVHHVDGDRATGSVKCVAHHLLQGEAHTLVTYLRYDDEFRRGADGRWRISGRDIHFLWTEEGPAPSTRMP